MSAEAEQPIDRSALSWAEACTGTALLEYVIGGNVEAFRSGERSPTDRQAEVVATLAAFRETVPKELQDAIAETTRTAFTQLLKEGYAVGPRQQMQQ